MPNRILRAELLESESWLALKDNADRSCWIACFLTVDTFGDMPAGPQRLVKLWRPYGIETPEKAAKVFLDLADVDLVRRYSVDSKPYLHLPRFGQSRRFLGHVWPLSPWATNEEKQRFAQKSPVIHTSPPVILRDPPLGVGVGVGVKTSTSIGQRTSGDNARMRAGEERPELPSWLPKERWGEFVAHRKSLRQPLTPLAERLGLKELAKLRSAGFDPVAVIEQSILNGWKGLFALKPNRGNGQPTLAEKRAANLDALCGRNHDPRRPIAPSLDGTAVLAPDGALRQPHDDDVG